MSQAPPLRPRIETLRESWQLSPTRDWTGDRWAGVGVDRKEGDRGREKVKRPRDPERLQSHGKRWGSAVCWHTQFQHLVAEAGGLWQVSQK